jgi:hypothetical protein
VSIRIKVFLWSRHVVLSTLQCLTRFCPLKSGFVAILWIYILRDHCFLPKFVGLNVVANTGDFIVYYYFPLSPFCNFGFLLNFFSIQANAPSNLVFWSQSQYIDNEIFRWCLLLYYFFFISIVYINLVIYCLSMAINISVPQWVKRIDERAFFNRIKFDKKVRLLRKNSILLLAHVYMQHTLFINFKTVRPFNFLGSIKLIFYPSSSL